MRTNFNIIGSDVACPRARSPKQINKLDSLNFSECYVPYVLILAIGNAVLFSDRSPKMFLFVFQRTFTAWGDTSSLQPVMIFMITCVPINHFYYIISLHNLKFYLRSANAHIDSISHFITLQSAAKSSR